MAQYDGSIRINTQINTSGASSQLMTLENRIVKTADKIATLRSKMDSLKNAQIPTQEYQEISNQIAKAESEFNKLLEKQEQMQREGKDNGVAWERLNAKMEEVGNTIRYAQGELQDLVDSGKAFTLGSDTQEYANLQQQLEYLEGDYSVLIQRKKEFEQKSGAQPDGYERLKASLQELLSSINRIMHPIESMKSAFSSAIANMKERAAGVAASIINGIAHPFQTMRSVASSAIKGTSKLLSGMASVAKKVGSAIKSMASRFLSIGKSSKSASGGIASMGMGFKNLLKYGLGIRSLYALVSKFRAAVKEGFGNLAQYSEPVNSALSSLKSSLTQLKNSLATAFAPILTTVAPALTALIDMVSKAATAVGMLIAALTGQKSFVKATKVQQGYADAVGNTASAAKDANKQLSSLDKLNNLTTNDSSAGGGGGGGGAGVGDMFETVDIPSKIKDLAKMIKEAWENSDFTEIGALLGTKLRDALNSIPWDKIQATAAKIGKSLATLINGFVEVEGLGYAIGNTIAQAINTALIGLESFAANLHWDSVGKFIAEGINGALENINWKTAISAAKHFGTGIAKAINSFLETTNFTTVGKTIAKALNTAIQFVFSSGKTIRFEWIGKKISDGINGFFKDFKAKKLAKTINIWVKGALDAAAALLKKTDFKMIGEKIGAFLATLDFKSAIKKLGNVLWEAVKGAFQLLSGLFKSAPLEASLIASFAALKFTTLGKAFANNLSASLNGAIASVMPGILAAFGEFFAVSGAFENLTKGTGNLIAEIGKIAGAVALAGAAMTAVFGFPAGLIAAAITGVTGAISGTTTALNEMEQQMKEEEEISKYGKTLSEMTDEIDRSSEAIRNRIAESENYINTAGAAEAQMAQDLSDRYFELADKENKTNEEMEEMQRLAGLLVDKMPELNEYYNEQTGLLDTTKQSVDNLIQSRLQEIKLNAIEEQLTQAYKDQAEALQKVEEAAAPVNDAQKKMNELQERLQELSDKTKLLQDYENLGVKIQNCDGDTESLVEEQQKLWNQLTNGGTESFPTFEALQQETVDAKRELEGFGEEYKEIISSFTTADEAYKAVNGNISRLTKMFTEGMTDSANKGIEGYNETMGNDTSMQNTATESARDIVKAFNEGQDAHSPSRKFMEAAKYSIDGYIKGITDNKQYALDTMTTLAKNIVQKFKDIKKDFISKGQDVIAGLKNGISEKFPGFSTWWGEKRDSIVKKFDNIRTKMSSVGKSIVNGIIDGIKSIWGTLAAWAQKIKEMFTISVNPSSGGGTTASSAAPSASPQAVSAYSATMASLSSAPIPKLATGAVIPANREFLAVLGDQKHGTNIEAPLDTIKQANREAVLEVLSELGLSAGNSKGGGNETFVFQVDGKTFFEITRKYAEEYFMRTGHSPYPI